MARSTKNEGSRLERTGKLKGNDFSPTAVSEIAVAHLEKAKNNRYRGGGYASTPTMAWHLTDKKNGRYCARWSMLQISKPGVALSVRGAGGYAQLKKGREIGLL